MRAWGFPCRESIPNSSWRSDYNSTRLNPPFHVPWSFRSSVLCVCVVTCLQSFQTFARPTDLPFVASWCMCACGGRCVHYLSTTVCEVTFFSDRSSLFDMHSSQRYGYCYWHLYVSLSLRWMNFQCELMLIKLGYKQSIFQIMIIVQGIFSILNSDFPWSLSKVQVLVESECCGLLCVRW